MNERVLIKRRINANQHIRHLKLVVWQGEYLPENFSEARSLYQAFQLRHQVFAEMKRWETVRPDRLEIDEFDQKARHFLLVGTDAYDHEHILAYTRLVKAMASGQRDPQACKLPMQKANVDLGDYLEDIDDGRFLELSRLVANPVLRNTLRHVDNMTIRSSDVLLYLTLEYCLKSPEPAEKILVIMEEFMCRRLEQFGIEYEQIGQPVEHKGVRYPIMIDPHSSANSVARARMGQLLRREAHGTLHVFSEEPPEKSGAHQPHRTRRTYKPNFPRRMTVQQVFRVDIGEIETCLG